MELPAEGPPHGPGEPLVEVPHQHPRPVPALGEHVLPDQEIHLLRPLPERQPQVDVEHVQGVARHGQVHADPAPRLPPAPGEVEGVGVPHRQPGQHGIAVGPFGSHGGDAHDQAHVERPRQRLRLAVEHLLEPHQVRLELAQHLADPPEVQAPVETPPLVDVVRRDDEGAAGHARDASDRTAGAAAPAR